MGLLEKPERQWLAIALLNFVAAALLGALLRLMFVIELPFLEFTKGLHAHSHVAMLGWLYMAIFALAIGFFLPSTPVVRRRYGRLFWLTQISVIGIYVTMLMRGYHWSSITFLSLHVVLSYVFMIRLFKDLKEYKVAGPGVMFLKTALWFMALSTFALWALGPAVSMDSFGSAFYYATIQFFLHFQFNGWFVFAGLAIFFRILSQRGLIANTPDVRLFGMLLAASTVLTYVLAVTWSTPVAALFWINSLGVVIQTIALFIFARIIIPMFSKAKEHFSKIQLSLFGISMICFAIKIIVQAAVVVPYIATVAYTIRNFVIGFIHLIMLGILTHLILGAASYGGYINFKRKECTVGLLLLITGFLLTEMLLFAQGMMFWGTMGFMPYYYELLFFASAIIPTGLLLLFSGIRSRS